MTSHLNQYLLPLQLFEPVSIDQLNQKNLLSNRQDRKFVFAATLLEQVLLDCLHEYYILDITGIRHFNYKTEYYDTHELSMYHQHQRGKKNRCKIRSRIYKDTNVSFVEIKVKNNKDRTVKHRISGRYPADAEKTIRALTEYSANELENVLTVQYKRITLVHQQNNEKVTIDTDLIFSAGENNIPFEQLIFAEVKTNNAHDIRFCNIMKKVGVRSGSLSKYCLGIMSFHPNIKQNNFKLSLKKLLKTATNANA